MYIDFFPSFDMVTNQRFDAKQIMNYTNLRQQLVSTPKAHDMYTRV